MSKRKITNSQAKAIVELLSDDSHSAHYLRVEITKNIIPHLFEEKTKLEVGSWYFYEAYEKSQTGIVFIQNLPKEAEGRVGYGFNCKHEWLDDFYFVEEYKFRLAREEEVKEALTKEAVKRGFVDGAYYQWVNCPIKKVSGNYFVLMDDVFRINGFSIMDNTGSWATIIPTITKEQAEKELGKKII